MSGRPFVIELAPSLDAFAQCVGHSATLSITHVYSGSTLYIPTSSKLKTTHPLAILLGFPLASRLCEKLGGRTFTIPTCVPAIRRESILHMHEAGAPAAKIARHYCVTERSVRMTIARSRATENDDA